MADKDIRKESWTVDLCKTTCKDKKWSIAEGEIYHNQVILFTTKNLKFMKNRASQIMKNHPDTHKDVETMMQPGVGRYQEWHEVKGSRALVRWFFIHGDKVDNEIPVYFIRMYPTNEKLFKETTNKTILKKALLDPDGNFIGDE